MYVICIMVIRIMVWLFSWRLRTSNVIILSPLKVNNKPPRNNCIRFLYGAIVLTRIDTVCIILSEYLLTFQTKKKIFPSRIIYSSTLVCLCVYSHWTISKRFNGQKQEDPLKLKGRMLFYKDKYVWNWTVLILCNTIMQIISYLKIVGMKVLV